MTSRERIAPESNRDVFQVLAEARSLASPAFRQSPENGQFSPWQNPIPSKLDGAIAPPSNLWRPSVAPTVERTVSTTAGLLFSRGVADDVEGCLEIARGLPEYFTPSAIETMGRDLAGEELHVAQDNLETVGFVCVKEKSPDVFEILWMAVRKTRTRCGIGTLIMDNLCRNLKSRGARLVVVKTLAPTVDYLPYALTRRFYEKTGFVLVEVIDPYPGWDPGNPCAIYVKVP